MKWKDIARQGMLNLMRHRSRTMLTVLGVLVGCCSVVIMISIGIGMRLSTEATLAQMGDLTNITLDPPDSGTGKKLDESVVQRIQSIDHVAAVIPKLNSYGDYTLYAGTGGRYRSDSVSIQGESLQNARIEGMELVEGDWDKLEKGQVLIGEYLAYTFRDTKRPEGYNQISRYEYYNWEDDSYSPDLPDAYIDPMRETITLVIGTDSEEGDSKQISVDLKIGGILKEDWNKGYQTSEGIIMDLTAWQELLGKYAQLTGTQKDLDTSYSTILVKADDIANVEQVEKEIHRLGYRTSSMESIRKPMEQDVRQKQMLLGGVGAVSLFVAALGIANTMIMAISERIREIGVMKALGCFLKDIRKMFLMEAGCIGLIGGIVGIGCSYLISWIMNRAGGSALLGNEYDYLVDTSTMAVSVIPWWLAAFAVLFSILIGVSAGFYPAQKAVRIPALEAIKHE